MDECIDQCAGELVEALLVQKYLLCWHKSTNTDAGARAGLRADVDSHAAARAKGVFCRYSVYLHYKYKSTRFTVLRFDVDLACGGPCKNFFASASVYLLYWYKSTGFSSTKVQILTQRCYIPAGIKFVCFRQSQACVERMIDAVLDALNKASGSTTTPPEAAANLADMLAGLHICVSSCCYMLYVSSYCYICVLILHMPRI